MRRPNPIYDNNHFWPLWGLAGLFEAPVWGGILGLPIPFTPVLLVCLHLLGAGFLFFSYPKGRGYWDPSRHWAQPMSVGFLLLPGLGWLLAALLWFTQNTTTPEAEKNLWEEDEESDIQIFKEIELSLGQTEKRMHEAADIGPAVDILFGDDVVQKRGAIQTLSRLKTPEAVAALLTVRSDPHPDARFYVNQALGRLKVEFEESVQKSLAAIFENPTDIPLQVSFSQNMYHYACSGLIDEEKRLQLFAECRAWLAKSADHHAPSLYWLYRVEKELSFADAVPLVDKLLLTMPAKRLELLKEKSQLHFRLREYDFVRQTMREMEKAFSRSDNLVESADDLDWRAAIIWWCHG